VLARRRIRIRFPCGEGLEQRCGVSSNELGSLFGARFFCSLFTLGRCIYPFGCKRTWRRSMKKNLASLLNFDAWQAYLPFGSASGHADDH